MMRPLFLALILCTLSLYGCGSCSSVPDPVQQAVNPVLPAAEQEIVDYLAKEYPNNQITPLNDNQEGPEVVVSVSVRDIIDQPFAEGIAELNETRPISILTIQSDTLVDEDLVFLGELTDVDVLSIHCKRVTDEGIAYLAGLSSLRELRLALPKFTDEGLVHLAGLSDLRSLTINGTKVTGENLSQLSKLHNLRILSLSHSPIEDEYLGEVTKIGSLIRLALVNTNISDEGLKNLKGMPYLTVINAESPDVTVEGADWLRKEYPKAKVLPMAEGQFFKSQHAKKNRKKRKRKGR